MKNNNYKFVLVWIMIALLGGAVISCKKNQYTKSIKKLAVEYNKTCPKEQANGTRLESVTYVDSSLVFRLTLTDNAVSKLDKESVHDSLINHVSNKLKEHLIKGRCKLEYRYVAPNDSAIIIIEPAELEKGKKKK